MKFKSYCPQFLLLDFRKWYDLLNSCTTWTFLKIFNFGIHEIEFSFKKSRFNLENNQTFDVERSKFRLISIIPFQNTQYVERIVFFELILVEIELFQIGKAVPNDLFVADMDLLNIIIPHPQSLGLFNLLLGKNVLFGKRVRQIGQIVSGQLQWSKILQYAQMRYIVGNEAIERKVEAF